jgi:hypothetical protein
MQRWATRQIVIRELGGQFADECYRNSPGNTLCDVRVEEHAVLPLWNPEEEDDEESGAISACSTSDRVSTRRG